MSENEDFINKLCNLEVPIDLKFSPDGTQVLYATRLSWGHYKGANPVSSIWLAVTGQPKSARRVTSGQFNDHSPAWSPDGKSVAFISDRSKAGERSAIYILPLEEGGREYPVTPQENEKSVNAFSFSPDGTSIAYLSADERTTAQKAQDNAGENVNVWGEKWPYARLRIVNLKTKQVTGLLDLERHVYNCCWSPDGKQIGIATFPNPEIEASCVTGSTFSVIDSSLHNLKDLCTFPNRIEDLRWPADGNLYYRASTPPDFAFGGHALFATDPSSQSPGYERVAFGIENDAYYHSNVDGKIFVKVEHGLESRVCLLDGTVLYSKKQEIESFDAAFVNGETDIILAIATSNVNQPVEVFTMTAGDNSSMVQLSKHGAAFTEHNFGTCSFFSCPSEDNEFEIESIYLQPSIPKSDENDATPSKPLPTVVMIHGGPRTRHTNAFNTYYYMWSPYLLRLGYGILIPNYRGSSGRGERFASAIIGGLGVLDYVDNITATQHAIKCGFADKERLVASGYSHGGYLSFCCSVYNGLHDYGWKFNAIVTGAGICDMDAMAITSDTGAVYPGDFFRGGLPWDAAPNDTQNRVSSPLWAFREAMERSKQTGEMVVPPILMLHGEKDIRCPLSQVWGMRRALEGQSLPFKLVIYPGQGHLILKQKFWIDMAMRVGDWCERYIGPGINTAVR